MYDWTFSGRRLVITDKGLTEGNHMDGPIVDKVIEQLKVLPQELQWRVLEFMRALARATPRGVSGQELLRFSGVISPDDAELVREAIDRGCEQVDTNEW